MLGRFSTWIYSKRNTLPKFDMAVAVTGSQTEWNGGLAHGKAACRTDDSAERFAGTAAWKDEGDWGNVGIGAHEIGHILGAPHDEDDNDGSCGSKEYIMSWVIRSGDELQWFFSLCSDRTIGEFVRSENANCLRRLDETSAAPVVDPSYTWGARAPSMDQQCKKRLNNPNAGTWEPETGNCKVMNVDC